MKGKPPPPNHTTIFEVSEILKHMRDFIGYRLITWGHNLIGYVENAPNTVYLPGTFEKYIMDDPYEMLRITYPLTKESLVVDLGGYKGEWAQRIYSRYNCYVHIYEGNPTNTRILRMSFDNNPKVDIFNFVITNYTGTAMITDELNYSSVHRGGKILVVPAIRASHQFERYNHIDLLKFNIEGSEYDVLPDLIKNYDMKRIKNIQIQFHINIKEYVQKRAIIQLALSATHKRDWCYDYVYESWSLK